VDWRDVSEVFMERFCSWNGKVTSESFISL